MSNRSDIPKRLIYTCKCGWVDKGHANPKSFRPYQGAESLWQQLKSEKGQASKKSNVRGFKVIYRQEMATIFVVRISKGVTKEYFVKKGLSEDKKRAIGLHIFMNVSEAFESLQGEIPYRWRTDSSFSAEDLISNLIGFYNVVFPSIDHLQMCQAVSKQDSLDIWDEFGSVGRNKNFFWGPYLYPCKSCRNGQAGPMSSRLPSFLDRIKPAKIGTKEFRYWTKEDENGS